MLQKGQTVFELSITTNVTLGGLKRNLDALLEENATLLPKSAQASVLLKPNFNSNMNALTGNTTDLRIINALIQFLKEKGYRNITIGEGTNSGFYRIRCSAEIADHGIRLLRRAFHVWIVGNNNDFFPGFFEFLDNRITRGYNEYGGHPPTTAISNWR